MKYIEELNERNLSYKYLGDDDSIQTAKDSPEIDFFESAGYLLERPKAQIGSYVAEESEVQNLDIEVPLITQPEDWQAALENGQAMIRSELPSDYSGYRGLFTSETLQGDYFQNSEPDRPNLLVELGNIAMQGLYTGEITPEQYMKYLAGEGMTWMDSGIRIRDTANWFNYPLELHDPQASLWQYIPGSNVSIFGDPHVEGRYHIGFLPPQRARSYQPIGGFLIGPNEHSTPIRFRKHDEDFVAKPFIDTYESVANMPLFDYRQRPVMELQMALDGTMNFLQYFKTGHTKEYCEPFDIPFDPKEDVKLMEVRGITPAEGKSMKLYLTPKRLMPAIKDEAIYCDLIRPMRFEVQFASKVAGFILHQTYSSFKNNHSDSSPLFMTDMSAGFDSLSDQNNKEVLKRVDDVLNRITHLSYRDYENVAYINIHVTSNGHEAVIKSDWNPIVVRYDELV